MSTFEKVIDCLDQGHSPPDVCGGKGATFCGFVACKGQKGERAGFASIHGHYTDRFERCFVIMLI